MLNIVFISTGPFVRQLEVDLFISAISKKYNIHKLSIKNITNREHKLLDEIEYTDINSYKELSKYLLKLKNTVVMMETSLENNLDLYNTLTISKVLATVYSHKGDLINQILSINSILGNMKKIIKSFIKKPYYDYSLVTSGSKSAVKAKKYLNIHSIKYDEYLNEKETSPELNYKYAVFLDQYVPHHPDIIHYWKQESVEPKKYFQNLNNFFDLIEKKYNLKVVISAHPKADYDKDTFNGREVIKYKTPNLIKFSEFVMLHSTTSVANVILANKPSIFLYYQEMLEKGSKLWTIAAINLSKELHAPLVDLENITKDNLKLAYNEKAYQNFKYKYLVNKQLEHKSNEQIVLEFLKTLEDIGK